MAADTPPGPTNRGEGTSLGEGFTPSIPINALLGRIYYKEFLQSICLGKENAGIYCMGLSGVVITPHVFPAAPRPPAPLLRERWWLPRARLLPARGALQLPSSWRARPFLLVFQVLSPGAAEFCGSPRRSFVRWSQSLPTSLQIIPPLLRQAVSDSSLCLSSTSKQAA